MVVLPVLRRDGEATTFESWDEFGRRLPFWGFPSGGFIDIDDSEAVIRAIEMTADDVPLDLVLHTPGGLVLAAEQIASALADHPGRVTV